MNAVNKVSQQISLAALLIFTSGTNLLAETYGPNSGESASIVSMVGSSVTWGHIDNTRTLDGLETTTNVSLSTNGSYTDYIVISNFNLSIDNSVSILGIKVEINRRTTAAPKTKDHSITLFKDGNPIGEDKATRASWSTAATYDSYGSSTDMWGTFLSKSDLMSNDFGVGISVEKSSGTGSITPYIDHVRITVYTSQVSLPVVFGNFSALATRSTIELDWNTYSEINNEYFLIEKSFDGFQYTELTRISGSGTTYNEKKYSFTDENPYRSSNYYRITQYDYDGVKKTYPPIFQEFSNANDLKIFPNPTTELLNICLNSGKIINIIITDVYGKIQHFEKISENKDAITLNIQELGLQRGMYIILFNTSQSTLTSSSFFVQ